ncbi:MAG TPA: hypothetical protein VGR35_17720 [Tepidisphaeraceae bacterium]|nr:hypothetical protein [Tepidisphaeraceae bacterium]
MGNELQVRAIERFHRHLQRLGRSQSLEATARAWVARYAVLWRRHYGAHQYGRPGYGRPHHGHRVAA